MVYENECSSKRGGAVGWRGTMRVGEGKLLKMAGHSLFYPRSPALKRGGTTVKELGLSSQETWALATAFSTRVHVG